MPVWTKVSGTWRSVSDIRTKVSGTWRPVSGAWARVSGTWRSVFVGEIGVFGGGDNSTGFLSSIDYVNIINLGDATNFGNLTSARRFLSATSNGTNNRGVFGGGINSSGYYVATIDYITITTPGNASFFGYLTAARYGLAAASNGTNNRGVFGGGYGNGYYSTIDYITITTLGNATTFGNLAVARNVPAATSNGTNNRGVFGGGQDSDGYYVAIIDYITITTPGNASIFGYLTAAKVGPAATSNGTNNRGVFGGGFIDSNNTTSVIEYITITTPGNATSFGYLTLSRAYFSATSNGTNNRGVFGGGYTGGYYSTIDYITITTPGNASFFGYLTSRRGGLTATSNA
jgi:hypothetical protein